MNFLLKIVEGPNKGAEIALVEGLCVTLGKADTCDIILADPTMPDAPLQIEAAADGVSLELPGEGRNHLEPYHVVTSGSTSFAVGSADSPWPSLVWPKKEEEVKKEETPPQAESAKEDAAPAKPEEPAAATDEGKTGEKKNRKLGWIVALIAAIVLLLILLALGWIFRDKLSGVLPFLSKEPDAPSQEELAAAAFDALIEKYSLTKHENDGRTVLEGDFKTRTERLAATAEAYATRPGIELDFADEESLKAAVEETLSLVGENELAVADVDKRNVKFSGKAANLRRTLEAVAADVPKIANVDCSDVTTAVQSAIPEAQAVEARRQAAKRASRVNFPVCGIVTNPYPCLVMSNGMRLMEGASIGENVIVKIEADKVTITNSAGRVVWKP